MTSPNTQNAYTHGLEKIYQFEVVNTGTVRPLATSLSQASAHKKTEKSFLSRAVESQMTIDLGNFFSKKMTSLRLDEPLDSLSLSPFALKALLPRGFKTIGDLSKSLTDLKGLGQGHIDEIRDKIRIFTGHNPFEKKSSIDFEAFLRILFFPIDPKDRFLFLERYALSGLFPLKPNELHEVEKWGQEMKIKANERTLESCRKSHLTYLQSKFGEIITALVKPWMALRLDISSEAELNERLFMLSESQEETRFLRIIELLKEILSTTYLFDNWLIKIADGFYAKDVHAARLASSIIERATSYFYTSFTSFELEKFCHMLNQDFAKSWICFPEGFIEKVLRCTSRFAISRSKDGIHWVQLRIS